MSEGRGTFAAFEDEAGLGGLPAGAAHVLGQSLDDLSASELAERIERLRGEVAKMRATIAEPRFARRARFLRPNTPSYHFGAKFAEFPRR
jgi:uncharacterized small protein (DUF1192 family)